VQNRFGAALSGAHDVHLVNAFEQTSRLFDLALAFLHAFVYQRTVQPETDGFLREIGTQCSGPL
jgi:hypothetical protein